MKKIIGIISLLAIAVGGVLGYRYYQKFYANNTAKKGYFIIPNKANFAQIIDSVSPFLKDKESFIAVAKSKNLGQFFSKGRYKIEQEDNNTEIVNRIKQGSQSPNNFRIGDFGDIYQMLGRVSRKTETDSLSFVKGLDEIAKSKGLNSAEDLKIYFLSNTYDFFWTVTPKQLFHRFDEEYQKFWTNDRKNLEKQSGLNRKQIIALASIVEKESAKSEERKIIAGLYINRFKKGMKLQSDPTVIYAINKKNNFSKIIKRLYFKDLKENSPYNTYQNVGIPPEPICIVSADAIDAILNADKNNYIYMCADPNKPGYHRFTNNDVIHEKNARDYRNWLDQRKIK